MLALALFSCGGSDGKPYRVFESPDKQHRIVVWAKSGFGIGGPGQGGDQPGYFQLEDAQGKVLEKQNIEMVQLVDRVEWNANEVDVRPHVTWKLRK